MSGNRQERDVVSESRELPRLTSDGGSQKDDARLNKDLAAGTQGLSQGAHHPGAGREYFSPRTRQRLEVHAKNHTLEHVLEMEKQMLAGKSFDEAHSLAAKKFGE